MKFSVRGNILSEGNLDLSKIVGSLEMVNMWVR
jgi:hypothetical protein